jgi:SAM-dependent methyltransferase
MSQSGYRYAHLGTDDKGEDWALDPETFMPDVWGWVCLQYDIKSVLDIGCGSGSNLAWFAEYGFDVLGVEGHPFGVATSKVPGKVICHDFTKGPWAPDRHFDLCLCTEFAEHVEAAFEENWMAAVDKCRYLLFSHGLPGDGGYHHVNEQPSEYWVRRFSSRGFRHLTQVTSKLRHTCIRKHALWGRNTLMFFGTVTSKWHGDDPPPFRAGVTDST